MTARRRTKLPTMATIAEEAGVARTTVSFVLNGHAKARGISEQTIQRVHDIAERLYYVPNESARTLSRRRSRAIGVLFAHLKHDWADQVVLGMESALEPEGYLPLIAMHRFDSEREDREIQSLLRRQVEAIVCVPLVGSLATYRRVVKRHTPLLFFGDSVAEMPEASYVTWDSEASTRTAVEHLVDIGRRRIAFVGWDYPRPFIRVCHDAYQQALRDAGLERRDEWTAWVSLLTRRDSSALPPSEPAALAARRMFAPGGARPDAVFVATEPLAVEMLGVFREMGLRMPEDVAVVTQGTQPLAAHPCISLTSIPIPGEEIGRQAAQAALDLIRRPETAPIQRLIPCGELQARATTNGNGSINNGHNRTAVRQLAAM